MAGVMVYGSGTGRIAILPVTEPATSTVAYIPAVMNIPPTSASSPTRTSSTHTPITTEYSGITGIRSVVETPFTVVATVTTSIAGQTTVAPVPVTTVVQAGTVVIVQPDPPDYQKTTNLVAILTGTLGCVVGMALVGLIIFLNRRAGKRQQRQRLKEGGGGVAYPEHLDEPKHFDQPGNIIIGNGLIATPFEFAPAVPEKDRNSTVTSAMSEGSFVAARQWNAEGVGTPTHQYVNYGGSTTPQYATTQVSVRDSSSIALGSSTHPSQADARRSFVGTSHGTHGVLVHDDGGPVRSLSTMTRTMQGGVVHPPPYYG